MSNKNTITLTITLGTNADFLPATERHDALTTLFGFHNEFARLQDGRIEKTSSFPLRFKAWGKLAEEAKELVKGTTLDIEGRLLMRSWTDRQTGEKVSGFEVQVADFKVVRVPLVAAATAAEEVAEPQRAAKAPASTTTGKKAGSARKTGIKAKGEPQ